MEKAGWVIATQSNITTTRRIGKYISSERIGMTSTVPMQRGGTLSEYNNTNSYYFKCCLDRI